MSTTPKATAIYKTLLFGVKKKRKPNKDIKETNNKEFRKNVETEEDVGAGGVVEHPLEHPASSSHPPKDHLDIDGPEILRSSSLTLRMEKEKDAPDRKKVVTTNDDEALKIRKQYRIFVWGDKIPSPVRQFSDIPKIPTEILKNLSEFGITSPTAVQMQVIPVMLKKQQLLASAPTGSGKTLAFAIPVILEVLRLKRLPKYQRNTRIMAIVLEPTRELAKQVYVQFLKFSQDLPVRCGLMEENNSLKVEVLVSTPYRLQMALKTMNSRKTLKALRFLILDEGDRLFDATEGEERSFRSQLAEIYQTVCASSKYVHCGFFSATFSYGLEQWCKENLDNLATVCVGSRNSAVGLVSQELVFAGSEHGKVIGLESLFQQGFEPPAIIFVQSKDRARQLYNELNGFATKLPVALISSDVDVRKRENSVAGFREGKIWILICTDLMSRGLDLRGVNLVVNFDLPTSIVSYIHRIGRAGRAGRPGRAITYFTNRDISLIRPIATVVKQAGFSVPEYTLRMQKLSRSTKKRLLKKPPKRKRIGYVKPRGKPKKPPKKPLKANGRPSKVA